ncbi:MAG: hypothetical protein IPO61_17930 [Gammaproteobacteria bacterium]|nr:hypothetical protein [Gammaproteobacteria bacterium]
MAAQGRAADASSRQEAASGLTTRATAPETRLYHRLVEQHYPAFVASLAEQGQGLARGMSRGSRPT